jgi:hypothetical protein
MIMENFARFAEAIYKRANDLSGGWLGILRSAVGSLQNPCCSSCCGHSLLLRFSLFPHLLVVVSAMSFLVTDQQAR